MAALRRTLNLQREEKLVQVHQAEENLGALKRALSLQEEEKMAQFNQAKRQLKDSQIAYQLSEIRWEKAMKEVLENCENLDVEASNFSLVKQALWFP